MDKSERQRIWDELLLDGWHRFHNMSQVYARFVEKVPGKLDDTVDDLKRVPRARKGGVRVAVFGSLGWLSRQLWAGVRSDAELIQMMTDADYDLEREVSNSASSDSPTRRRNKLAAQRMSDKLSRTMSREWNQVKAVRSK
jgi:hypothetical protein